MCLAWFALFSIIAAFFVNPVLAWLARPVGEFIYTSPSEAFLLKFKIAGGLGFVAAFPIFLIEMWRFVEMALEKKERSLVSKVVPASLVLFFGGMALAVFGVLPLAVKFLLQFSSPYLKPMISLNAYLSFLMWMVIGFGLFFQLPIVILFLTRAGVVTPDTLGRYRRHALMGIILLSAVLTPGPDVLSLVILAVPSYLLFECSIFIARRLPGSSPS